MRFSNLRRRRRVSFLSAIVVLIFFSFSDAQAATFTVTNTNDSGAGSLRQAIFDAIDSNALQPIVQFNIAGGGAVKTIMPLSPLPRMNRPIIIDGMTQPGYAGVPLIEVNGASAGLAHGFEVDNSVGNVGAPVIFKALILNRFAGDGIHVAQCQFNCESGFLNVVEIYGCYIGTNASGTLAAGNGGSGVVLKSNGDGSKIGGTGANERNVIAGNAGHGIKIIKPGDYPSPPTVWIFNNYIGTNAAGAAAIPNGGDGINVAGDATAFALTLNIGGANGNQRNVISGNGDNGILINATGFNVNILGNYIGTNAAGTAALGNGKNGVRVISGDAGVGSSAAGGGNTVSGNNQNGLRIEATNTGVYGNRIGTNAAGTTAIGNALDGIEILSSGNFIGDAVAGAGNTISGNGDDGIDVAANAANQKIYRNRIGVDQTITAALGNGGDGLAISSSGNFVGLANVAGSSNFIGGNSANGILLAGANAQNNDIFSNYIGTNQSGADLGNGSDGVRVVSGALDNRIGSVANGAGNTIAFNAGDGVRLSSILGIAPSGIEIRGNSIYSNDRLGIDLGGDGITPNDFQDSDTGANGLQNFPNLPSAWTNGVYGTFSGAAPNQTFVIDFYRAASCDFSNGAVQGRNYNGSKIVTTDANGNATFLETGNTYILGEFLTATATSAAGDTSEFAICTMVLPPPGDVRFAAAAYSATESGGAVLIGVNRTAGGSGTVSVDYATSNGTAVAGQDFQAVSGTLIFNGGETFKTISIPVINDASDETAENFSVALSNVSVGSSIVSPATAIVTIGDDDAPPTVSISDVTLAEGNFGTKNFNFVSTLSNQSGFPVQVAAVTDSLNPNATATGGIDFLDQSQTLSFAPGETTKNFSVAVVGELVPEADEIFFVQLFNAQNATIADGQGKGTILDDDRQGELQFAFAGFSVAEGTQTAIVTVTRANGAAGSVSINYATQNGTATAGSDYAATGGTLVLGDKQTSKTFTVPILNDAFGEANETVNLTLSNPLGGAILGNLTTAVLTILDDDGGLPANVSIGGQIVQNGAPLPNVLIQLSGSNSATAVTNQSGNYNFTNLAAGGNYLITPTSAGSDFEPSSLSFTNLAANVANANFVATAAGNPARKVRVVPSDVQPGGTVALPIELISQDNENGASFSLSFDQNLLSSPQVSLTADTASAQLFVNDSQAGKIGIALALPAGQTFQTGARQLVKISFSAAHTNLYSTALSFGNTPTLREVTDPNANALPSAFVGGLVTFAQGFEADVAPRPSGNGTVTITDLTQIGKFIVGSNAPDQLNEFQRTDCAPKGTKGNGQLSISDYTQAGLYASGIDALQTAGGATQSPNLALLAPQSPAETDDILNAAKPESPAAPRVVRVVSASTSAGQQVLVSVEADANGDENGYGFSINYDATNLSNPLVQIGAGATGAVLFSNTLVAGKIGVILVFPTAQAIQAGTRQIITIRFDVAANAPDGMTDLFFGDSPAVREVSDVDANVLPTTFTGGAITILAPTVASVVIGGRVTTINGRGVERVVVSLTDANGATRKSFTNPFGYYRFADVSAGETYILTATGKRFSFAAQTQILTVYEENLNVNFVFDATHNYDNPKY